MSRYTVQGHCCVIHNTPYDGNVEIRPIDIPEEKVADNALDVMDIGMNPFVLKNMCGIRFAGIPVQPNAIFALKLVGQVGSDDDDNGPDQMEADPMMVELNIVETAQDTESVSSLVAALAKADESASNNLISTLSDETTNFTVLAPTNDAFADLLARLDGFDSLDDFNTEQLQNLLATVLTYHVVGGAAVTSSACTIEIPLSSIVA